MALSGKTLSKYDLYPNVSFDISPENKPINTKVPFLTSLNYGKRSGPVEHPQQSAQFQTILNPEMHDLDSSRLTFDPVDADVEHPPKHGEENEHYVVKKYYSQDMISDLDLTESLNIWQLHNKYIISQIKSGMAIIDQHVAHERVLYEHAMESFEQDMPLASQQLLFPETIELNPEDFTYILDLKHYLEKLGFSFKFFGKNTVVIEAVPADVRLGNEIKILQQIIDIYKENEHKGIEIRENIAISYSCKTAIKAGDKLSKEEMNALIDQLFATKLPYVCPHGRPIIIKVDLKELDRKFLR